MNKRKILASILGASGLFAQAAFATNGDNMVAVGSENTALGGTGVAHYVGAESTFANPAMLGLSTGREVNGGITIFKADVASSGATPSTMANSAFPTSIIPDVSYSSRINDSWTYGFAVAGSAGMGVDYSNAGANYSNAKTAMEIAKIVPTVAYNTPTYGLGFSPVIQYGSLAISYTGGAAHTTPPTSKDTGMGYNLGGYYNLSPTLKVAAAYNSQIVMHYGNQLSDAGAGFVQGFQDTLTQPAEIKLGVSVDATKSVTLTADFRQIQWGSATGYEQFGWDNQNVFALGGKYTAANYWLGLGANITNNPINAYPALAAGNLTPWGNKQGIVNFFNNLMFPATEDSALTFGGGYSLTKNLNLDGAFMYAPKVTTTVSIAGTGGSTNTTTHSEQSLSLSLRYKY